MSKHLVLMQEIVCNHHPEFLASKDLTRYGLKHPEIFNIERLVEESLAHRGYYEFVDKDGYDFTDYSDSKTATVVNNGGQKQTKVVIIQNVENKIGALRTTVFNPYNNSVAYFYIPKQDVRLLKENSGTQGSAYTQKERIRTSWNSSRDDYNKLEYYRVNTFLDLANS